MKNFSRRLILALILICSVFSGFSQTLVHAQSKDAQPVAREAVNIPADRSDELLVTTLFTKEGKTFRRRLMTTLFVIISGYFFMFLLISLTNRSVKDLKGRHVVRKNIVYFISFAIIITVFLIWVQNLNSITIFLGVASAGVALALQEVILCVAGWLLILIRRPFEVGDRIEIKGVKGDVIDIRLFQTSLLEIGNWVQADQSTGRIVNFPNSFIYKHQNYNFSRGFEFIWHEIPILVTFESDWKRGREIILSHAKKMAEGMEDQVQRKIEAMRNRYMIYYGKLTPIVYVRIRDSGVELTLRYLTEAKRRRFTENELSESILHDFEKEPSVNFAYPTYRIVKD